jgi:hypothetical protein
VDLLKKHFPKCQKLVIKHLILRSAPVGERVEDPDQPGISIIVSDPHTRPSYPDPDHDTMEHRLFLILCGQKWVLLRSVLRIRPGFSADLERDPAFYLNAEPDLGAPTNADPDPGQTLP